MRFLIDCRGLSQFWQCQDLGSACLLQPLPKVVVFLLHFFNFGLKVAHLTWGGGVGAGESELGQQCGNFEGFRLLGLNLICSPLPSRISVGLTNFGMETRHENRPMLSSL